MRWIWEHSLHDLEYSVWAPGFPRNLNETDDCVMMAARSGYFWEDIR